MPDIPPSCFSRRRDIRLNCYYMRKAFYLITALVLLASAVSCKKDSIEYVTLSQLASKCDGTGQFDVYVQNVYITAASSECAVIEDRTQALRITKSGLALKSGSILSGHITGKAQQIGANFELSDLSVLDASVAPTDSLPCTTATIAQIMSNETTYRNRRVKITDIMFTEHFNGHFGDQVVIVQKGKPFTIQAAATGYYALAGDQGDIICYPADGVGYVFSDKEFNEHEVITPLSRINDYGLYSIENDAAKALFAYRMGNDQYAFGADAEHRFFRIQNFYEGLAVSATLTTGEIRECSTQEVTVTAPASYLGGKSSLTLPFFLEKKSSSSGKLWLMNYENGIGLIIKVEE